jgi:hypothetical protein
MLNDNKCWLCGETFPRRKQKKVFQVYQVLQFFESISKSATETRESKDNHDVNELMHSDNLKACYASYLADGGHEKVNDIVNKMRSQCEIEPWMSGLTCSVNEHCLQQYSLIVPDKVPEDSSSYGIGVQRLEEGCPPGCGCDNPWAFIK